jgi:hypothetical protein
MESLDLQLEKLLVSKAVGGCLKRLDLVVCPLKRSGGEPIKIIVREDTQTICCQGVGGHCQVGATVVG